MELISFCLPVVTYPVFVCALSLRTSAGGACRDSSLTRYSRHKGQPTQHRQAVAGPPAACILPSATNAKLQLCAPLRGQGRAYMGKLTPNGIFREPMNTAYTPAHRPSSLQAGRAGCGCVIGRGLVHRIPFPRIGRRAVRKTWEARKILILVYSLCTILVAIFSISGMWGG